MMNSKLTKAILSTLAISGLSLSGNAIADTIGKATEGKLGKNEHKYLVQFAPNYVVQPSYEAKKDTIKMHANNLTNKEGVRIAKLYSNSGIASVYATATQLAQLKKNDNIVNIVRADAKVDISLPKVEQQSIIQVPFDGKSQNVGSWGIDRIDQRDRNYDGQYNAPFDGSDVIVYVMDSGVELDHPMLKDRVAYTKNTYNPDAEAFDCHGHGSHVIGTVGVQDYGVAPSSTLVAIRPFNDNCGAGTQESFVGAIEFAVEDSIAKGKRAVVNMSLGYTAASPDAPLDFFEAAIDAGVDTGVVMVTSTGNDSYDTCGQAIARMSNVISVAASREDDLEYMFTNDGPCVDLYAPGVDIVSMDWFGGVRGMSGTSMAAPHVAGAAALVLDANPHFTPQQVQDYLIEQSTKDVLRSFDGSGAENRLLYVADIQAEDGPVTGSELSSGVTINIDGTNSQEQVFTIEVPDGKALLDVVTVGDNGDADLYVSFGSAPTTSNYDCRSYTTGSDESCSITNPQAGIYHVMVRAYSAFTNVDLTATYSGDVGSGVDCIAEPNHPDCQTGEGINESNLTSSDMIVRTIDVAAGQTLTVNTSGGTGDADLFVNFDSQANEWWEAQCTSRGSGNNENCVIENTQAGTYHITIKAYQGQLFEGLTLTADAI